MLEGSRVGEAEGAVRLSRAEEAARKLEADLTNARVGREGEGRGSTGGVVGFAGWLTGW